MPPGAAVNTAAGRPAADRRTVEGPAGRIEILTETPATPARGFAFIGHPHPLYGGTLDNKVAATLARAFLAMGWIAVRPNFRGVGQSQGEHDNGIGETTDFLHLIDTVPHWPHWTGLLAAPASAPIALSGFSFGTFVAARAAQALAQRGRPPSALVLVGAAAGKWAMPPVDPATVVIHGEIDETIALADVYPWARDSGVPVVVMPAADHFFHRRLTELKRLIVQNVLGAAEAAALLGAAAAADSPADAPVHSPAHFLADAPADAPRDVPADAAASAAVHATAAVAGERAHDE